MCGRYTLGREPDSLLDYFHLHGEVPVYHLSYNIAPTQQAPVIVHGEEGRRCARLMRWGLVPHWSAGPDARFTMINARAESVSEKPAYRDAFRQRRCLVPCDGFYEWHRPEGQKRSQPYYIRRKDGAMMAMAGIWDEWSANDESLVSFSIVTTVANEFMQRIHKRMPVILEPQDYDIWLENRGANPARLTRLLLSRQSDTLNMYPVSLAVNSPDNNSVDLIKPL